MKKHFRGHFTYLFPFKFCIPNYPVAPAEINGNLRQAIVHGQAKAVTFYAFFITQGRRKNFAKCNAGVLNGMMFIDMQVAIGYDLEIHAAVPGNLIEHMVKKMEAGRYPCLSFAIEVNFYKDVSFFGTAAMLDNALAQL